MTVFKLLWNRLSYQPAEEILGNTFPASQEELKCVEVLNGRC